MSDIRNKTINGIVWNALQSFGTRFVQLLITIIIARILSPSDYGLIGMLYIFIALGNVILDGGFGQALIRKKEVNDIEYSSVFYFNLLISFIIYVLLYISSPFIASFYNQNELINISRVIFLTFPINALGLIQNTIIIRNVNFKLLSKITLVSTFLSGLIGVILAYNDYGVWSLVIQSILSSLINVILLWINNKWRPNAEFQFKKIKNLLNFSLNLLSTNILIVLFNNIYTIIIGKYYNLQEVGYYNQAKKFQDVPTSSLTSIIQSVSYPILSKIQDDDIKLKISYRKIINMASFINFPIMFGLIPLSNNLFKIFLNESWLPAVPYFQILCIYGAIFHLHSLNVNILKVKDKTQLLLKLEIFRRFVLVLGILLTINNNIEMLLIGSIISALISILVNMYFCGNLINLNLKKQIQDVLPIILIAIIVMSVMFVIDEIKMNIYFNTFIQIIFGFFTYLILSYLFKINSFIEIKSIIKDKIIKNKIIKNGK